MSAFTSFNVIVDNHHISLQKYTLFNNQKKDTMFSYLSFKKHKDYKNMIMRSFLILSSPPFSAKWW